MTLLTESIPFGATTKHKVVFEGNTAAPHGNFGVGARTFKSYIYNDGDAAVTVYLDGSEADAGYGLAWTTRASVSVPARGSAVLSGAIRGQETLWRLAVKTSSGTTKGRIEVYDMSDGMRR